MINTNRWNHLVPRIMQQEVKCYEVDSKRISERFGNSADCLEISVEGNRQCMNARIRGNIPIPSGALDGVTRESIENNMKISGGSVARASMDMMI